MDPETDVAERNPAEAADENAIVMSEADKNQLLRMRKRIQSDRRFFHKDFEVMRENMLIARTGMLPGADPRDYKANFTGQHIRQKTASLYAKNPRIRARRRETLDFAVWDEDPASLKMAFETLAMAQQLIQAAAAQAPAQQDPMTGAVVPALPPVPPEIQAAFEQAQAVVADYQQGIAKQRDADRFGRTIELLFNYFMGEQNPVDFKTGMKRLVRRTCTTAVGYVKLDFQRAYGPQPRVSSELADARARLEHVRRLVETANDPETDPDDPEIQELEDAISALQAEPEIVLREGLVFDFIPSTRVIPDELTRSLVGFVGARHVTVEYLYTKGQVRDMFGVKIGGAYKAYALDGKAPDDETSPNVVQPDEDDAAPTVNGKGDGLVCVWEHFDKASGLVYYLADGYGAWLKEPAPPNVKVETFWPVFALTFNDVEDETKLFPPSDVMLLRDMQKSYNEARQGQNWHRYAARPRWAAAKGALDEDDINALGTAKPFSTTLMNRPPDQPLKSLLEPIPVPGVDPNLYETNQFFTDAQITAGTSAANLGGLSKATATESAIAANASASADGSGVDDLDSFLTLLARAGGQILMREMSPEMVTKIVGAGAFWPEMTDLDIAEEITLEVEAGSTGKPNRAVEVQNFKEMAPLLLQIPGIKPERLAMEGIRRLDDRLEVREFVEDGIAAIVAQNRMAGQAPQAPPGGDPQRDPNAQGDQGADNGPRPPEGSGGSQAAFGSNQM